MEDKRRPESPRTRTTGRTHHISAERSAFDSLALPAKLAAGGPSRAEADAAFRAAFSALETLGAENPRLARPLKTALRCLRAAEHTARISRRRTPLQVCLEVLVETRQQQSKRWLEPLPSADDRLLRRAAREVEALLAEAAACADEPALLRRQIRSKIAGIALTLIAAQREQQRPK